MRSLRVRLLILLETTLVGISASVITTLIILSILLIGGKL